MVRCSSHTEACITYLYFKKRYAAAYAWARALLRRLHVLVEMPSAAWDATSTFPAYPVHSQTKLQKSLSGSGAARESLDIALRCMLQLHPDTPWALSNEELGIVAAAFHKVRLDPAEYRGLVAGGVVQDDAVKKMLVRRSPNPVDAAPRPRRDARRRVRAQWPLS